MAVQMIAFDCKSYIILSITYLTTFHISLLSHCNRYKFSITKLNISEQNAKVIFSSMVFSLSRDATYFRDVVESNAMYMIECFRARSLFI